MILAGETGKSLAERKMNKLMMAVLMVFVPFVLNAQSQSIEPLKLIGTIPIPGLHDGDFDQFTVDSLGQRLFLTAEENSAVEVFDLGTNKLVHTISDLIALNYGTCQVPLITKLRPTLKSERPRFNFGSNQRGLAP